MEDYFNFRTMISSGLIKIIYVLGAIVIIMGSIYFMFQDNDIPIILSLLSIIAGNLLWRLICETIILFFSIHEELLAIRVGIEYFSMSTNIESNCEHADEKGDFCTKCGKKLNADISPTCAHEGESGNFCVNCGAKLIKRI